MSIFSLDLIFFKNMLTSVCFVYFRLLRNTVCSDLDPAAISNINKKIMHYLVPLRALLKNYQRKNLVVKRGIGLEDIVERVSPLNSFWEKWTAMQHTDVSI